MSIEPPMGGTSGPQKPQEPLTELTQAPSGGGMNAFRQMFGGTMTEQQFKQFVNEFIKQMITQMKQDQDRMKEALEDLGKSYEQDS